MSRTILVTGATGKQGGAATRRLLAGGWAVRAMVRTPEAATALAAAGAEPVIADLDDPDSLDRAVAGVYGMFTAPTVVLGPTGFDPELEAARGRALLDAARAAGVEHVVLSTEGTLSAADRAVERRTSAKIRIEQHLWASGLVATVLRPVRFMSNYLGTGLPIDGIQDGVHRHLFPVDGPMQIIAVDDIAEFAALAFAGPDRYAGRTLELAGDQPAPTEAAAMISAATGLDVRYRLLDRAEAELIGPGVAQVWDLARAGHRWRADIEVLRVLHPGLRTLRDWLDQGGAELIRRQADTAVRQI